MSKRWGSSAPAATFLWSARRRCGQRSLITCWCWLGHSSTSFASVSRRGMTPAAAGSSRCQKSAWNSPLRKENRMKKALVTGIAGQDGFYLQKELTVRGYAVHGLYRGQDEDR